MFTTKTVRSARAACFIAAMGLGFTMRADDVELINGDVLTGTITAQTDQGVTLDHPVLGTVTLPNNLIAKTTVKDQADAADQSDVPQADATQADASQSQGAAGPSAPPATHRPAEKGEIKAQALEAAASSRSLWQQFREDWTSRLTLGFNGSNGATERNDFRVRLNSRFSDGADRYTVDANWLYATVNGDQAQNRFQADVTRDWLQKDKPWFFFVKGQYRFDDNRSWQNRTSAFGGGGYTLKKTNDVEVNTRLGFGGTYEYGTVNEFTPEALFGGSVVKWQINERAAISGEAIYFPSLEDTTQFRIESSIEWTYKLDVAEGLSLKLGVENEYDSSTANEDVNNDIRYYGAIVLSF